MVIKSRWKGAHDRFPAHVEEAKNSDGNVHRGYFFLEFRVAAELLRVGPAHSREDYWAPSDWQLLLVVSEFMSALLEFLDWFWPDLGWEHHKQAIVLSKRLLQPRSPNTYPDLQIDPHIRAAWQSFTYCFWHGTRHLPAAPPPGEPAVAYKAAREWLTKLVGDRGFEVDGHIVSALQSWIQSTRPRLEEAFPAVDWSHWPTVLWPSPECGCRTVEKRGAIKRQQEEDYAVRWPLRVTQGRPKFNHLKLEARDGFVVGIPPVKNPPALGFMAVSDVICAFKQAALHWPSAQPGSSTYLAQQDVVQSFVQNVLRETRGPLAPGLAHDKYRYLGHVACSVLGWNFALSQLSLPVGESSIWGPQPLALPGGAAVMLLASQHGQYQRRRGLQLGVETDAVCDASGVSLGVGHLALPVAVPLDLGISVDLGIAAQVAMQPELLMSPAAKAALALHLPQAVAPVAAGASTAARAAAVMAQAVQDFGSLPLPSPTVGVGASTPPLLAEQLSAPIRGAVQPHRQHSKPTRPRPSPFLARTIAASSIGMAPCTESPSEGPQRQGSQALNELQQRGTPQQQQQQPQQQQQQMQQLNMDGQSAGGLGERAVKAAGSFGDPAAMSLGGLSSMQDLIDGLPSQADLTWSAILGAAHGGEHQDTATEAGAGAGGGPSGTVSELMAALPSLLLPSGIGSLSHPAPHQHQHVQPVHLQEHVSNEPQPWPGSGQVGLQAYDRGLPYVGPPFQLQPRPPPRSTPDAPIHVHPPSRATSPCQATITTGALPSLVPPGLAMPSLTLPSAGLSQPELSAGDSKFTRRSHGEVSTLSPVTSCGCNGEVVPCSPAPPGAAAAPMDDEAGAGTGTGAGAGTAASGSGARSAGSLSRDKDAPEAVLTTGSRRTRQDVAAAAAAAAADQGMPPAPGSLVERSAKRPNAQADPQGPGTVTMAAAERVESLGAFLTDQQAGFAAEETTAQSHRPPQPTGSLGTLFAAANTWSATDGDERAPLGRQLLKLLRSWVEEGEKMGQADDAYLGMAAAAEVHRRAEELLERGAPVDVKEGAEEATAAMESGYGHTVAAATAAAGYTPLHWACRRGDVALAELLLRHGADPDCPDRTGTTARLVNPAFAATLTDAEARCGSRRNKSSGATAAAVSAAGAGASNVLSFSQVPSCVFVTPAGGTAKVSVAAQAAATVAEQAATQQNELRNRLAELLHAADQVAAQLVLRDPQSAAEEVLKVLCGTDFLCQCIVSGPAGMPSRGE